MRKKLLCSILCVFLLLGLLTCFPAVQAASAMVSSDNLVEYIKAVEGFSAKPYWDYGQYTVGYGTRCPDDKYDEYSKNGISQEDAVALLRTELTITEAAVNSFMDKYSLTLKQHQFDALITFTYNCGSAWLNETDGTLNQAIRNGATGNALIYALTLWSTAGGEFILLDRRLSEANMYLNGQYTPYNGIDPAYPDTYRWVFLNGCGGEAKYRIFAYDSSVPVSLDVAFKSAPAGYSFDGWYTAGGIKVTTLDSSLSRDQVLYARWKNSAGQVIPLSSDGPVNMTVTVTENNANLRKGPGTHSAKLGTVSAGTQLTITELHTTPNYVWGRSSLGWIAMELTSGSTQNVGGWVQENGKWAYYVNGQRLTNSWAADSGGNCYLDSDGYMVVSRWLHDGNSWYYIDSTGHAVTNAWKQDSQGWCYLGATGQMVINQWANDWNGPCYIGPSGYMVTNSWAKKDGVWYYMGSDGYISKNTWAQDSHGWCYLGSDGKITVNAWLENEQGRVYVNQSGYMVVNGWAKDGSNWCYMDANGQITYDSWVYDGKGWCYQDHNGWTVCDQWVTSDGTTRYLDTNGYALTNSWKDGIFLGSDGLELTEGWGYDGTGWFYLNPDKTVTKNAWLESPEGLRYVGADGYALTSCWHEGFFLDEQGIKAVGRWISYSDAYYYIGSNGYPAKSTWFWWDSNWFYLDTDGIMVKNRWVRDSWDWCYLGADGYMLTNSWAADSAGMCYLGHDGYMVRNRWIQDGVSWFYIGSNGYMLTNSWAQDSKGWCYLGTDGIMVKNRWVRDSWDWCYINSEGYMLTDGWAQDSIGWYWMGSNGYPIKNTSKHISGKEYHFNASGICTNP